jgi:hypothetical protein
VRLRIGNIEHIIDADLVVDASGRGSSSPAWLESLGYIRPAEERIEIGIGYTTRIYRRRPTDLNGKYAVVVAGSGPNWRNGRISSDPSSEAQRAKADCANPPYEIATDQSRRSYRYDFDTIFQPSFSFIATR